MLIKIILIVFLSAKQISLSQSENSIELKWTKFEYLLRNQFNKFFDKKLVDNLLNQTYVNSISMECRSSLINLVDSLSEMKLWAIQMLDSSAKLPASGLLTGTVSDLGQYDECLSIKLPSSNYTGQYCTLKIKPALPDRPLFNTIHDKIPQLSKIIKNFDENYSQWLSYLAKHAQYFYFTPIRLGICVPSACTSTEINQLISYWFEKNLALDSRIEKDGCETLKQVESTKKFGIKQWISIGILSTFFLFIFLGTLTDILDLNDSYLSLVIFIKRLIKYFNLNEQSEEIENEKQMIKEHKLFAILNCFSIQRNLSSLFNFSDKSNKEDKIYSIDIMHGLKVFAMSWVLIGHTYGLINPEIHQKIFVSTKMYSNILSQPFLNATLSVNTFFAISGLLTSWTLLNINDKQKKNFKFFMMAILSRLFRLLPAYIGLLCVTFLFNQIRSGPLWLETVQKPVINNCEYSIWPNLLFVNNFFNTRQMCLMHSWYLSVDVQFYLFGLFLFFLYLRNKILSFSIMILSCILATFYSLITTYIYNYPPTILATAPAVTERWNYILDFYYKPFCHLSTYILGFYFGYALYCIQTGAEKSLIFKIYSISFLRNTINVFMALLGLLTIFSIWPFNLGLLIPQIITSIYASIFRFCWSLSLLWFIVILTIRKSGLIYKFLAWKAWLPLSRMTYSIFLFHPIVIWVHFGSLEHPLSYNHQEFIRMFTSNLFLSIILALISSLVFESPLINLQKLMIKNSKKSINEINSIKKFNETK